MVNGVQAVDKPAQRQTRNALRTSIISACALVLAVAALIYRIPLLAFPRGGKLQLVEFSFVLFASIALIVLYNGFADRFRVGRVLGRPGLIFVFAPLLALSVYKLAMYQFGGCDESYLATAAKHYADGLRPYVDFPSCMPPMFLAGIRASVLALGLRWANLAVLSAVFAFATSLWLYGLLRTVPIPRHWALALTAVFECSTMLLAPFWWYNNTTSISVLLFIASVFLCIHRPAVSLAWISLAGSLGMLLAAKPNAALICLSVPVLFVTVSGRQRVKVIVACLCAGGVALLICAIAQTPSLELAKAYHEVGKLRGSPLLMYPFRGVTNIVENFAQGIFAIIVLICSLELLVRHGLRRDRQWSVLAIMLIAIATGVEMTMTNGEPKPVDLVVLLGVIAFLSMEPGTADAVSAEARPMLAGLMIVFGVWSVFFGATHLRILEIGEGAFFEHQPTRQIQTGYFAGLEAGPRFASIQEQIKSALGRYPAKKVFFGPRLESEYAAFNRRTIPVLPMQFAPGDQYPPTWAPTLLREFKEQDPDLLVILKHDYSGLQDLSDYIRYSPLYRRDDSYNDLTLYIRQ